MTDLDADCPTGGCPHPATAHEPDDYTADGTPTRPICCVPGCRCGHQWRTT